MMQVVCMQKMVMQATDCIDSANIDFAGVQDPWQASMYAETLVVVIKLALELPS